MSTNVTYPVAVSHLVVEVTEFLSSLSPKNAYPAGYSKRSSVAVPSLARSRSGPAVLTASNEVPKPPFSTSPNAPTVFCRRFRKVITQWFPTVVAATEHVRRARFTCHRHRRRRDQRIQGHRQQRS